jgi:hypothetical protein
MTKFRWLLVTLLALTFLSASGISPANAATASQLRDPILAPSSTAVPPTSGVLGGGSGGGVTDGDPDDIIEGNRVAAMATGTSTQASAPIRAAVLLWLQVGGVILLLRRILP